MNLLILLKVFCWLWNSGRLLAPKWVHYANKAISTNQPAYIV